MKVIGHEDNSSFLVGVVGDEDNSSFLTGVVGHEISTHVKAKEHTFDGGKFELRTGVLPFEFFYTIAENVRDLIGDEAKVWPSKHKYFQNYKEAPFLRIYFGEEYISLQPRRWLTDVPGYQVTSHEEYEAYSCLIQNLYISPRNSRRLRYFYHEVAVTHTSEDDLEDRFIKSLKEEFSGEENVNYARLWHMYKICYRYALSERLPIRAYFTTNNGHYLKGYELPRTMRFNDKNFCYTFAPTNSPCAYYHEFSYKDKNSAFCLSEWCAAHPEFDEIEMLCIKPFVSWVLHYIKTRGVGYSIDAKTEIASKIKNVVDVEAELEDGLGNALVYGSGVYPSMHWVVKDTYTALFRVLTRLGVLKQESGGVFRIINTRKIPVTKAGVIDVYSILDQCEERLKSQKTESTAKSAA